MKKFLPLTILTLFILTACGSQLTRKPMNDTVGVTTPSASTPVETQEASDPEVEIPDIVNRVTGLKCSDLKSPGSQEACELQLSELVANILRVEIVDSFDASRCKELPEQLVLDCEEEISQAGVQGPVSDSELALFDEIVLGDLPETNGEGEVPPLYPSYDASKCAQLTAPGYKEYCESRVSAAMQLVELDKIVQSGDSSRCDSLGESLSVQCKQFFGIELPLPELDDTVLQEGTTPPGAEVVQ